MNNIRKSSRQRAVFLFGFTRNLDFHDMFEKYSSTKFREIPSTRTDGRTDMTKLIAVFRNLTHLIRSHFSIFSQTQKASITQVGNFVETRLLAVALNQTDGKQRNEFLNLFRIAHNGNWIRLRETNGLEGKESPILQLNGFLVLYYYYNYYICFHLYARYLQLYTWNKPCLWYTVLQLYCIYPLCYM